LKANVWRNYNIDRGRANRVREKRRERTCKKAMKSQDEKEKMSS
jgi:hypothetical protein